MWTYHKSCTSKARLDNKVAVITGANVGIGKETARDFYTRGARVILACRNMEKAQNAVEDIKNNPFSSTNNELYQNEVGSLAIYLLDLSSLKSIRECAKKLITIEPAIHILVNNAAAMKTEYEETEDGFELQLQSNYLGHFLLTLLLLPKIRSSGPGCRIVNVSSRSYVFGSINLDDINLKKSYSSLQAYSQSKLANILFTKELARRLKEADINGINVYSLHPGVVKTDLFQTYNKTFFYFIPCATFLYRHIYHIFAKNSVQGAQTTIYCAIDEKAADETGLYYVGCHVTEPHQKARDDQMAKDLWNYTCQLLHLNTDEIFSMYL